ncbi:protein BIG GRAIN 1-like B [Cornus florida]|uniref:protein BIG GRAIN 1-like B n=1 Tax=Cornus florida TaxID=4283 RepID=UPI00289DDF0A|nr:protein BIG GRAIN 1-like B [Cornus florida]
MMNTGERYQQRRKTPSFSSTLLDAIYRSIDESNGEDELVQAELFVGRERKKQSKTSFKRNNASEDEEEIASFRRAIMIEKWMENHSDGTRISILNNSASSSSESSCGGVFSSSETESTHRDRSKPSVFTVQRPKQIRTAVSEKATQFEQTPKREGRFMRTNLKALKIYGDLKKVRPPISPGGRITNFLNSLFNSKNAKNANREALENLSSMRKSRSVKESTTSTCSSASSFSRSCLSKAPFSRGKSPGNGMKRSVRFFPVSVIVDEDCRPCGHKSIYEDDPSLMPIPIVRKIAEAATLRKELKNKFMEEKDSASYNLRDYKEKRMNAFELRDFQDEEDDDDDDDVESDSSSDLFELENIGAIGMGTYREELPVYGTTDPKKNHAIANVV